jgi:hypothetical protein
VTSTECQSKVGADAGLRGGRIGFDHAGDQYLDDVLGPVPLLGRQLSE